MAPAATNEQLKTAYRERARRLHPDAGGGRTSAEMAALNEAWRVLRDPDRRATYDADLAAGARAAHGSAAMPGSESVVYGPSPTAPLVRDTAPARVGRGLWLFVVLMMMGVIFVFTAFAGRGAPPDVGPEVDGYLATGDCVLLAGGEVLSEVACSEPNDGTVRTAVRIDLSCPDDTVPFLSPVNALRICVALRTTP